MGGEGVGVGVGGGRGRGVLHLKQRLVHALDTELS